MIVKQAEDCKIYKMVSSMNVAFGNKKGLTVDENKKLIEDKKERLLSQLRNLYDENKELKQKGFDKKQREEIFDAIADLCVFLYGGSHFIDKELPDFTVDLEDKFEIFGKKFSTSKKEDAIKYIKQFSLEKLDAMIDQIIQSVKNSDLNSYNEKASKFAEVLFVLFEIFKKEGSHYDMIYLNKIVLDSNLSKLCRNMEEVEATLKFYRDKHVEVDYKESDLIQSNGEPFLFVYSLKDQFCHDMNENGEYIYLENGDPEIKEYRKDKFLKNTKWFEPDLTNF